MAQPVEETDEYWMQQALRCAEAAAQQEEVPVGAVVVAGGQLIAKAHNRPIQTHDPTAHAEILAIRAACQVQKNYRLTDATLYVTLEPCPMCAGALLHARIQRLVYGAADPKTGAIDSQMNLLTQVSWPHKLSVTQGVLAQPCGALLKQFFAARRG